MSTRTKKSTKPKYVRNDENGNRIYRGPRGGLFYYRPGTRKVYLKRPKAATYRKRRAAQPSTGWAQRAPQRGRERNRIKQECGNKCFLLPDELAFPVCPVCPPNKPCACEYDCRGILAAKVRSNQWKTKNPKYARIARRAQQLGNRQKCKWAK